MTPPPRRIALLWAALIGLTGAVAFSLAAHAQTPAPPPAASTFPPTPGGDVHFDKPQGDITRFPGDGRGAYQTHRYRDLFVEQLGVSPVESKAKVEAAFRQLFHGDGQDQRLYFETGANANGPLAYITDWANNDVRTEGMSYGMIIAVELGKKREFDALWNWANTYMLITDRQNPSVGYFAWSMGTDGSPHSTGAAPDGEEYFVMALYFAAHRWGNGKGIYNYQAEADKILRGMRHHPVRIGTSPFRIHPNDAPFVWPQKPWPSINSRAMLAELAKAGKTWPPFKFPSGPRQETVGPMVEEPYTMIRFVPEEGRGGVTDISYHLPAFYELWGRWGPKEDRAFWLKAADVSRDLFVTVCNPETGLSPDLSHFDGTTVLTSDGKPDPFGYDSWRTVSNWSVDYEWWGKDERQRMLSDRIQTFLYGQNIHTFADRYTLDGQPLSSRHSPGLLATAAVGSFAATPGATSKTFLQELWDMPVPAGDQRYFDGMLYLMSLMHASGNFRIIAPPAAPK